MKERDKEGAKGLLIKEDDKRTREMTREKRKKEG